MTFANHEVFLLEDVKAVDELETPPKLCKNCNSEIISKHKAKIFCTGNCRKRHNKPIQNSLHSPTTRRENIERLDRIRWGIVNLTDHFPVDRGQWLQDYIDNPTSARVVGNPHLLRSGGNNIAKVANRFTQQVYRYDIKTYLKDVRDSPDKLFILYDYSVFEEPLSDWIIDGPYNR
tara:strand:+ start:125 stop:652 length:528 start_codon:yes stop_codon:yes gene_type:complete